MCLCSDMGVKQNTQEVENYLSRPITVKHVRVVQSKFRPKSKCQYFSINIWKHVLCIKSEWAWVVWKAGHRRSRGSRCLSSTCCSNTLWRAWTAALIIHPGLCINKPFPLLPPFFLPFNWPHFHHCPAPSLSRSPQGRPALEWRSWGRISLQAGNMSHVSQRWRLGAKQRCDRYVLFFCFDFCLQGSGRLNGSVPACLCCVVRVTDSQIEGLRGAD